MRAAWLLLGTCAWACSNDFDDYRFRSNESASGGASATGGLGGSSASGGTGGTAATGGVAATGGTGATGGATGGTGGATGGTGGATGGAAGATGGTGGATGGAAGASGGTGGAAGAAGAGGGQGGTGGTVATCEQIYQGETGVNSICLDTPQFCELNFSSGQATCNAICAAGGGECEGVFDNNGPCGHGQPFTCGTNVLNEGVCVCSHGCGSGPPCPSGQTCDNGNCN